jgi:hypothetical protein
MAKQNWVKQVYDPGKDDRHFYWLGIGSHLWIDVEPNKNKTWAVSINDQLETYATAPAQKTLKQAKAAGIALARSYLKQLLLELDKHK